MALSEAIFAQKGRYETRELIVVARRRLREWARRSYGGCENV
jgi:hypothetical protein